MAHSSETLANGGPENNQIAVVMVPLPAQGHLNQLLHLSRLISAANLPIHFLATATHVRQARQRVHGWPNQAATANIRFHEFQTTPFDSPPPDPNSPNKFPSHLLPAWRAAMDLREPFYTFIRRLSANLRRVVVVFDSLMAYVVQDVGSLPNVEAYCFLSVSAFTVHGFRWEFRGMTDDLPPGAEIQREAPGSEGCFTPECLEFIKLQNNAMEVFSGHIYNSSRAIEGVFLDLLQKGMELKKPPGAYKAWAVGPFNPIRIPGTCDSKTRHHCLEWLDNQDTDSVIFVSFGTTTSISKEQIRELAIGLERSQQKFIWVFRDADKGDIFTNEVRKAILPKGFEDRTKEQGMIIRGWAPQLEILAHVSTGGFLSHCGWNSCMESISMGVPIAAWPMHSDQPRNAALVTKVLRIGVEVKDWAHWDEIVKSETVEKGVRKLMGCKEGNEIRKRARELGGKVRECVVQGGSSYNDMESFLLHITR